MKQFKMLCLGSAAALCMMVGARATDLPGAEPVDYVKVCDVKGKSGFFYIPGSDTCLQVGGSIRFELSSGEIVAKQNGRGEVDFANRTGYRARARVWFDSRTETEYGAVRTFIRVQIQRETGSVGAPARISNGLSGFEADDSLVDHAFVQFGGLTAGIQDSFWDFKDYPAFQAPFVSDRTVPLIGYTAKVDDVSASIALEDETARYRSDTNAFRNAGQEIPDIVANVRVKQGWGEAQVSGVAHRINPKSNNGFPVVSPAGLLPGENSQTSNSTWGWAVQAGLQINLPTGHAPEGEGDNVFGLAGFNNGAGLSYSGLGDQAVASGTTQNLVSFQPQRDFLQVDGKTQKTQATNFNLGVKHYWSPQWRSVLQGTFVDVNYKTVDADWRAAIFAGGVIWTPAKKLDIGAELAYVKNLDRAKVGYTGPATSKDDDALIARMRVQRIF